MMKNMHKAIYIAVFYVLLSISVATARDLREGMSGEDVKNWQFFLISRKLMKPPALGNFGVRTRNATVIFQKKVGLTGTGVVGSNTIAKARKFGYKPSKNSESNTSNSQGPGLPLVESYHEGNGIRAIATDPVMTPSKVSFAAIALVSQRGIKLENPIIFMSVSTYGENAKWSGIARATFSFAGRKLLLQGNKSTEPMVSTLGVFESIRIRFPYKDFASMVNSGKFYITVGDATFEVNQKNSTGLRELVRRIS